MANVKGHLQPLSCLELLRILNFYTDLAPLKDGLNFDDRPLKTIGFLWIMFKQIASAKSQGAT